uniref:Uncharacterized protein n=1 Tax=Musca domestica TaxID=7370 RepID=A0A1I8NHU2_MUSDO
MKSFIGLFAVTLLALNGVLSLPARNPSDDAEVIGYPRRVSTKAETDDGDDFHDFKGVIDTGSGYPFLQPNPSILNFGFFDSFDDIFRRFSARFWPHSLLGRGDGDSDENSGSDTFGISTNFDPKKGNTTSTVKVIDGHKVEVNETVYGDEHSVFKVRVVNVRPLEDGETVEETVRTGADGEEATKNENPVTSSPESNKPTRESTEDDEEDDDDRREPLAKKTNDNEIERNIDDPEHSKENIVETPAATTVTSLKEDIDSEETTMLPTNAEELNFVVDNSVDEVEAGAEEELNANENNNDGNGNNEFETNMSSSSSMNGGGATIENNEDAEDVNDNLNESSALNNAEEFSDRRNEFDSSDDEDDEDVKHSNYDAGASAAIRTKPREDISSSSDDEDEAADMHPTFYDEWGSAPNKENNDLSNDIDVYDVEPVDLSNDIAVNDAPDLPINPDAEFIDVFGGKQKLAAMPKFEKLSLSQPTQDEDGSEDDGEHLSSFSGEMK